jgi:hypothetical protein
MQSLHFKQANCSTTDGILSKAAVLALQLGYCRKTCEHYKETCALEQKAVSTNARHLAGATVGERLLLFACVPGCMSADQQHQWWLPAHEMLAAHGAA